jgi:hypothetical protein
VVADDLAMMSAAAARSKISEFLEGVTRHIRRRMSPTSAPGRCPHLRRDPALVCAGTAPTSAPGYGPHLLQYSAYI